MRSRLWVVSELYAPDAQATSKIMTRLAEGLVKDFEVMALCAYPTMQFDPAVLAPSTEVGNGVHVRRLRSLHLDKAVVIFRVLNLVSISVPMFFQLLCRVRRGDRVLVVTNPPVLPFVAAAAARCRGARCVVLVHDVYPDVLVPTGLVRAGGVVYRTVRVAVRWLFRLVDGVVAIGRDMQELLQSYVDTSRVRVELVPNWGEPERITPRPRDGNRILARLGLTDRFVILHAGTMGRIHGIEDILAAARRLKSVSDVQFLFAGFGVKRVLVEHASAEPEANVHLSPVVGSDEQNELLNACDVTIISMIKGMTGISVPSRLYNTLASGRPIIAVTEPRSELARVIQEAGIGWVVAPGAVDALVHAIEEAQSDREQLMAMGRRARALAELKYTADASIGAMRHLLMEVGAA